MQQGLIRAAGVLAVVGVMGWVGPARGVIVRQTPLADVLKASTLVASARVESLDPDRPAMMLVVVEALKGKAAQEKLPVLLTGDAGAVRRKEPAQLLKRLAKGLPVVLFVREGADDRSAFVYSNGTWFSLSGTKVDGEVRWSLSHLEPYLRRTYAGTTKAMVQTVRDAVAGKGKPPAVNEKEKPGLGPEVAPAKKTGWREAPARARRAVIPTVLVGGPLAMLAMLFPAVFAGWKRWLVLLSTGGTISTLFTLQWLFAPALAGSWWGTPAALWALTTAAGVLGIAGAFGRHVARVQAGEAPAVPGAVEVGVLLATALAAGVGLGWVQFVEQQTVLGGGWWPATAFAAGLGAGAVFAAWARFVRKEKTSPVVATEAVVLTALVLACTFVGAFLPRGGSAATHNELAAAQSVSTRLVWSFRLPAAGAVASSPLVVGERVFVAAAHDDPFRPHGAVYCLERATGKLVWTFHDGRKMKQVFSSPVVVGQRLYIGEGFHQDQDCRVFCLNAETGEKVWEHATASHTEATPCVHDGRVYCGAGDDGLFCLDAITGKPVWNFSGFHIDAGAVARGGRVYAGCGVGETYRTTALFCLDAGTGRPRWRCATDLPVWGRPVVRGGFVYAGTGNGRMNQSDAKPAGAVVCVGADDGAEVWKQKLPDGVLGRLAADRRHLFFGCRDGFFYCLRRSDGKRVWRRGMGSAVVAGPALEAHPSGEAAAERVYAVGTAGFLACLEPASGKLVWGRELSGPNLPPVEVIATPALDVRPENGAEVRRLYVALTQVSSARTGELRCYEETE
jgi:outer membrane protein assembly factor BamB